jgi:hypothetical protein
VFGKIVYDTTTAEVLYSFDVHERGSRRRVNGDVSFDSIPSFETLYRTPEGRYFCISGGGIVAEHMDILSSYEAVVGLLRSPAPKELIRHLVDRDTDHSEARR